MHTLYGLLSATLCRVESAMACLDLMGKARLLLAQRVHYALCAAFSACKQGKQIVILTNTGRTFLQPSCAEARLAAVAEMLFAQLEVVELCRFGSLYFLLKSSGGKETSAGSPSQLSQPQTR